MSNRLSRRLAHREAVVGALTRAIVGHCDTRENTAVAGFAAVEVAANAIAVANGDKNRAGALAQALIDRAMTFVGDNPGRVAPVPKPIEIWPWDDAPPALRELSECHGDEVGCALLPAGMEIPFWLEAIWRAFDDDPQQTRIDDGRLLVIWTHA